MNSTRNRRAQVRFSLVWSVLICLVLLASNTSSYAGSLPPGSETFEVVKLPATALAAPPGLMAASAAPSSSKMDSALAAVANESEVSLAKALDRAHADSLRVTGDRIQVKITTVPEVVDDLTQAILAAGGEVTGLANGDTWMQAWLPVTTLNEMAARDEVSYIGRPAEAITMATTEGLAAINGQSWQTAGYRGAGVKVAIIDGGFQGYPSLLGSDLPASVTAKNFVDGETDGQVNGTTPHGTACAEIVYDIAPNATIYLAKVSTDVDLQEAVNWAMNTHHVDIITTSLGWYNVTPGDGTGFFANLVQTARNAGILWTTAAGNDREAHWGGAYSDSDSDNYHNFAGTQEINWFGPGDGNAYNISAGYAVRVYLRWDDWSAVNQNYSLSIVRWNGTTWQVVATSNNAQNGGAGQKPTEYAAYVTSGSSAPYGFVVQRVSSGRNVNLEIFAPKVARLDKLVHERSLANLADAPAAMTVAALDVNSPYPQESYSSEGPTNGSGGTATDGAVKPDISGFANVSTISYPAPNKFNGTSSATPHVAGAAALVKSAYPAYTPAQIQSFLQGRAIDMGSAGKDTLYGYGRLYLGTPPNPVVLSKKVYMPIALQQPALPGAPVLNAIANADGDGNYTVSWNAVSGATSYTLVEDDNPAFSSPTTRYTGAGLSWNATGKAIGTYYYKATTSNAAGTSGWSNVVSTVVQPATGPTPGFWQQSNTAVEFYVTADRTQVDDFAIYVNVTGCGGYKITRTSPTSVSGNSFAFSGAYYASGTFSSVTAASGTTGLNSFYISGCGYVSGGPWNWSANWLHSAQATVDPAGDATGSTVTPFLGSAGVEVFTIR